MTMKVFGTTKLATAALAGVLSLAVTGAAAFAAFQPVAPTTSIAATDTGATASLSAEDRPKDGTKTILDKLVANGTITQAQEDAILKAFKDATEQHKEKRGDAEGAVLLKRLLADLMKLSVSYIGLPRDAVSAQLRAGKSLGEIADTQPGKSRQGLIDSDVAKVSAQIDALVAAGKVTKERADEFKSHLTEHVTKLVDHKYDRKPSPPKQRKPAPSATAKPTT